MADPLTLNITRLGALGDGIAETQDGPVYIPFSLPGEQVQLRLEQDRPVIDRIVVASPDRVAPACPHFGICGGCTLQHLETASYRDWKRGLLQEALSRRGIEGVEIADIVAAPMNARRRARMAARKRKGRVSLGFNQRREHAIVDLKVCPVLRQDIVDLLPALRDLLAELMQNGQQWNIQITSSETGLDLWIIANGTPDLAARERSVDFAEQHDLARLSWGDSAEPITVRRRPAINYGKAAMQPPPGAFLQATLEGEIALISTISGWLDGARSCLDLYAGCGAFSLSLATAMKIHAVDIAGDHLDALDQARRRLNGLREITLERRNLKRRPLMAAEMKGFDALIFDPPRAGAREQAEQIAGSSVARVAAVSCNPATFARDARILIDGGFRLREVVPIDQFLWTAHLELAALFTRT